MGCGGSKFDSEADKVPVRIRPLLRRRFEEMRIRRRTGPALKNSPTGLSKKELLKDGASDSDIVSSPSHEFDGKSISSQEDNLKVAPLLESDETTISKDAEHDHKAVKEAPILRSTKVAPAPEPEKLKEEKSIKCNAKDEDKEGTDAMPTAAIFAAVKAIKTTVHVGDRQEEDEDEIVRLSSITADSLYPGSPSFRVYFIEPLPHIKDDDDELQVHAVEDKNDDSDKKSIEDDSSETTESRNSTNADSETKKRKKAKRGSRLRRVLPMGRTGAVKNLLNVKSC
ncbi:conserved hypothetical protein [Ricinus communis]|uniref:Uncharacterized protein n=1 Tax=Ricinus communis TaxID=3988 RepID=B9RA96_RICCO|nr:conserved hypothetical protein [Ricinus communis]